ncbi:MAG: DUF4097 family beta strand repeat-containing protein [Bacteroidota bacterium]
MRKLLAFTLLILLSVPAMAQDRVSQNDDWCDDDNWNNNLEKYCEVREYELKSRDQVNVDGGQNGGISIIGWDKNEILVRAKVSGRARSERQARELVEEVEVSLRRTIEPDVPQKMSRWGRKASVSVSFEIYVPHETDLSLETHNGGVRVKEINGDVDFDVLNGGVSLSDMAGNVSGHTTNGGVSVRLTGDSWEGEGLDVSTTNGGVTLKIPEDYSAKLVTGTVNGRLKFDFPVTVQGNLDRKITTKLGSGGKTIRVMTTNGGVSVKRS